MYALLDAAKDNNWHASIKHWETIKEATDFMLNIEITTNNLAAYDSLTERAEHKSMILNDHPDRDRSRKAKVVKNKIQAKGLSY